MERKSKFLIGKKQIYPETDAECVRYSDTTLKKVFDNYEPIELSEFGKKVIKCESLAEICKLFRINYFFAKDLIDNVNWTVVGTPEIVEGELHATDGNRIWRAFTLGAYDLKCEFDLTCAEKSKICFQLVDSTATAWGATQAIARLQTDEDGGMYFRYLTRYNDRGSWTSWGIRAEIPLGSCSAKKRIKILYSKDAALQWEIYADGKKVGESFTYEMSTRNWQIWLGNTADCLIDNFSLTYNSEKISELDFD